MRIFTRAALFATLSLLLCLAPRAQARGDEPAIVRVETSDYDLTSEPYYGEQAGIFKRHGIALQFLPAVEGGANMMRDIAAGKSDVGFSNLISIAIQVQNGTPIVLVAPAALHDRAAMINPLVVALAHRDVVRRFMDAMRETARWSNAHRAETAKNLALRLKLTPDVIGAMSRTTFAESLTPETIQPPLDVAAKYGLIKPMKAADLIAGKDAL